MLNLDLIFSYEYVKRKHNKLASGIRNTVLFIQIVLKRNVCQYGIHAMNKCENALAST